MSDDGWVYCNTAPDKYPEAQFDGDIHENPPGGVQAHHRLEGWNAVKVKGVWKPDPDTGIDEAPLDEPAFDS